jgi:hypothetical protein
MRGVMHEFKHGELHSGSSNGPKVTNRKQAIAIGLSEQRQMGKDVPPPPKKAKGRKSKSTRRGDDGQFGCSGAPAGAVSHRPRPLPSNLPKNLAGRRSASHTAAYPEPDDNDGDDY